MRAFYNEIDRYCCDWLQNLMDAGHITPGKIDDRSIADLTPDDCRGYERCHFFAGIAGWELAVQMSQYNGPVWTGSCPCQPFSSAGKGKASSDERHLWPIWFELIRAVRPPVIFGEQVEAAIGWGWLDLVHSDMEAEGYSIRSAVLPACSVGAPHIRQRLWFVAEQLGDTVFDGANAAARNGDFAQEAARGGNGGSSGTFSAAWDTSVDGELAHSHTAGLCKQRRGGIFDRERPAQRNDTNGRGSSKLAHSNGGNTSPERQQRSGEQRLKQKDGGTISLADTECRPAERHRHELDDPQRGMQGETREQWVRSDLGDGNATNPWSDLIWLPCTDGKQRPTQPGIFPLAHGLSARVGRLRAAGNAIVPQVAAQFIKASMTP